MKQLLIYSLILLFALPTFAQKQEVDSLLKVIKNKDIDRSEAYNLLYKNLKRTDLEMAKAYLDKGYNEAI